MAICFELVVNFGVNEAGVRAAHELIVAAKPLVVGLREIRLHEPLLHRASDADGSPYIEMSVLPVGVGWAVALDRGHERVRLSTAELTDLGHQLYQLLTKLTGYRAAFVGWDPEPYADPAELRRGYSDDLAAGTLPGLVLAEDVLPELRGTAFRPFARGFVWLPYEGEGTSSLTTGETA